MSWLIDENSAPNIMTIFRAYLEKNSVNYESFSDFSLNRIGVASKDLGSGPCLSVIQKHGILQQIAAYFTDEKGVCFGEINDEEISSEVLFDQPCLSDFSLILIESLSQLGATDGFLSDIIGNILRWIVPIRHYKESRIHRRAFSHPHYLGAVFLSIEDRFLMPEAVRSTILSVDLSHEVGHQVLNLYQFADPIIAKGAEKHVLSPVRQTERTAIQSFHANVAIAYMIRACESLIATDITNIESRDFLQRSLDQFVYAQKLSLEKISQACEFSNLGQEMWVEMSNQIEGYRLSRNLKIEKGKDYLGLVI